MRCMDTQSLLTTDSVLDRKRKQDGHYGLAQGKTGKKPPIRLAELLARLDLSFFHCVSRLELCYEGLDTLRPRGRSRSGRQARKQM